MYLLRDNEPQVTEVVNPLEMAFSSNETCGPSKTTNLGWMLERSLTRSSSKFDITDRIFRTFYALRMAYNKLFSSLLRFASVDNVYYEGLLNADEIRDSNRY